jgi:hypothetical protein
MLFGFIRYMVFERLGFYASTGTLARDYWTRANKKPNQKF